MPRSRGGRRRAPSVIVEILEDDALTADQHGGSLDAPLGADARASTNDLSGGEGAIPDLLYRAECLDRWPQEKIEALGRRLITVQALAAFPQRSKRDVAAAARELGVNVATVYRDLSRLQGRGTLRDLAPRKGGYPKGRARLNARQEELITRILQTDYLTQAKPSMVAITEKIGDACEDEGLGRPGRTAIIRRLRAIPKRVVVLRRSGPKAAEQQTPRPGRFDVQRPWDVWQIDHTLADVIVVDQDGRPIGRVWLTVVIDVCTRMIVAFYIGLEPPSAIRVATTLDLAVSDKAAWLAARDLEYAWPAQGLPRLMHSDRAKEFTSPALQHALLNHGVGWFLRPPGRTRYGGHIERLIGTLMGTCRLLPGATHNSPKARGSYDSKTAARLRIDELEMYFAHQILGVYHQKSHSALGMSPLQAWTEKSAGQAPNHPEDVRTFRLDLFPGLQRTIGRQGVKAFNEEYYSQRLGEAYIAGVRTIVAKYDPRDLSRLYVRLPGEGYIVVPYRLPRDRPAPTLWLVNLARRTAQPQVAQRRDRVAVRRATEAAEAVIKQTAPKSTAAARQAERLRRDRVAVAAPSAPIVLPKSDDDWGGAFGGGA
jgi:putative transposase